MAEPRVDIERAAEVLVAAHFGTDAEAAKRYGITDRTVRKYRKMLETDSELSAAFLLKLEAVRSDEGWDWLTDALRSGIRAALDCFNALPKDKPESLLAINQSIEVLTSYEQTRRVIDAELAQAAKQDPLHTGAGTKGFAATVGAA